MDAAAKIALAKKLSDGIDTFQSICIAFLVLITVTFTLRMFSRIYIVRCFEAEDWTMVVAFILSVFVIGGSLGTVQFFRELLAHNLTHVAFLAKWTLANAAVWLMADVATRLSFGFFFLSIFSGKNYRKYRLYITIVTIPLVILGITLAPLMIVKGYNQPIESESTALYGWNPFFIIFVLYAFFVVWSDFSVTALSIYMLCRVRLPLLGKICAILLLAIQCLAGVAAIVRLTIGVHVRNRDSENETLEDLKSFYWSVIEVGLGIITANMALTRPLFVWIYRKYIKPAPHFETLIPSIEKGQDHELASSEGRRSSFEITKTQVITVVEDPETNLSGLARTGLIGESFMLEVSRS